MTKDEAAEYLGMSERSLERHTKNNRISVRYERGKTKPVPVYERPDLDRFKAEMERPVHRPVVEKMATNSDTSSDRVMSFSIANPLARPEGVIQLVEAVAKATAREVTLAFEQIPTMATLGDTRRVAISEKMLLSLNEARALTGLSAQQLRLGIRDGHLQAKKIGRGWKMRPEDVRAFVDQLLSGRAQE